MKIFKGKTFFIKSIFVHIFLVLIIAFISINLWESPIYDTMTNLTGSTTKGSDEISLIIIDNKSIDSYRWPWQELCMEKFLTT